MKALFSGYALRSTRMAGLGCLLLLVIFASCKKGAQKPTISVTTIATGLPTLLGIETDNRGNVWVTEEGTQNHDAKVVVITPSGKQYDAIVNLPSFPNPTSQETQGGGHLLLDNQTLYVLSGNYLYTVNLAGFKPGNTPMNAIKLPYEDIGAFSLAQNTSVPNDTHPYNLTKGPGGDLYIADAGANTIIHRTSAGNYSILAKIPGFTNPLPVGPPVVQSVPTGIIFDGHNFLVTTLTGFPFPPGVAVIYQVTPSGAVSVYQPGFTTLTDIAPGNIYGHLVVHFGTFGATGFMPNTGSLLMVNGSSTDTLVNMLNMPASITQANDHTWYMTITGDNSVIKVSYN